MKQSHCKLEKKEQKKAYKDNMDQDIETVEKNQNSNKSFKKKMENNI